MNCTVRLEPYLPVDDFPLVLKPAEPTVRGPAAGRVRIERRAPSHKRKRDDFSTDDDDGGSGDGKEVRRVAVRRPAPKAARSVPAKTSNQNHARAGSSSMENILSLDGQQRLTALAEMLGFMSSTILSMRSDVDFLVRAERAYGRQALLDEQRRERRVSHTQVEDDEEELEYVDEVSRPSEKSLGKRRAN